MLGIDVAFVALQVIAVLEALAVHAVVIGRQQEFVVGEQWRSTRPQISKDHAAALSTGIGGVADLFMEGAARGLTGLLQTMPMDVVQPTVIDAAQATVFQPAIAQVNSTMRAM